MIDHPQPLPGPPGLAGRHPFYELVASILEGAAVNVGKLTTTTHLGTHLDAPWHYLEHGGRLESVPLEVLMGPCRGDRRP